MMRERFSSAALGCAALLVVALSMRASLRTPVHAHAPAGNEQDNAVGLVVQFANGVSLTRCVRFAEAQLTGYDVLVRAALPLEVNFSGPGAAICRINNEGCPADNCFCQCQSLGGDCRFWNYWHWRDGVWTHSDVGASNHIVRAGDIEGWAWGAYSPTLGAPLPAMSLAEICAVSTVPLTPLPVAPTANPDIQLGGDRLPTAGVPAPAGGAPVATNVSVVVAPAGATITPVANSGAAPAEVLNPRQSSTAAPTAASTASAPTEQATLTALVATSVPPAVMATKSGPPVLTPATSSSQHTPTPAVVAVAEQRLAVTVAWPASPRPATATVARLVQKSESRAALIDYGAFGVVIVVLVGLLLVAHTRRRLE